MKAVSKSGGTTPGILLYANRALPASYPQPIGYIYSPNVSHSPRFTWSLSTWSKGAKKCLRLVVFSPLSCNAWGRAFSLEELILGPWTWDLGPACLVRLPRPDEAHSRALVAGTAAAAASLGLRTQDSGLLSAGCPNFCIPFLRALTLPEFPNGPEPCGTRVSQTWFHFLDLGAGTTEGGKGQTSDSTILDPVCPPKLVCQQCSSRPPPGEVEQDTEGGKVSFLQWSMLHYVHKDSTN